MEVKNKIMYHFHKQGVYDEMWNIGNEIIVDNNFRSFYSEILDTFTTAIHHPNGKIYSFDRFLDRCLDDRIYEIVDKDFTKQLLLEAKKIITKTNVCRREFALEQIRKELYPYLPSRLHSIWLTDNENMDFWKKNLVDEETLKYNPDFLQLYQVNITGNLFKSSDYYIPYDKLTMLEMMEQSKIYWNPTFDKEETLVGSEYLFQGKVKIIKKIQNNLRKK